jgi:hypothetical protein
MEAFAQKIPAKMQRAIVALLQSPSISSAAKSLKVGEVTLYRWLGRPDFKEAFDCARRQLVDQAITKIQESTESAAKSLREIMEDPENPASARVTAARTIFEMALRGIELQEFERRLTALEGIIEKGMSNEKYGMAH